MTPALAAAFTVVLLAARARGHVSIVRHTSPAQHRPRRRPPPSCEQWAAFLDAVAAEVRTGSSLAAAVQHAVQRCAPNGAVIDSSTSVPLATLDHTGAAMLHPDEAVVVHALLAAHDLGGPIAPTIDAASALLRERNAIRDEANAHAAQARLSARVLTTVPLIFMAWSLASSGSFRSAVLGSAGALSVSLGAICNLTGWWWMLRIIDRAAA